jgi:hypothetical protein
MEHFHFKVSWDETQAKRVRPIDYPEDQPFESLAAAATVAQGPAEQGPALPNGCLQLHFGRLLCLLKAR